MNADKLPDVPDDPVPAAETPRLTDSPQPEKVPRPSPEAEHPSPPDRRQPPDREPEPERESHDEQGEPESEHRPESPAPANESDTPAPTDSPSHLTPNTPDTADTSESRSRQEHADYHPSPDAAPQPLDPVERADQEEAPPAKATPSEKEKLVASDDLPANPHDHPPGESEVSSVQEELPDEAGTKPDRDKEYGGAPPQEDPPDPQDARESTSSEGTDQKDIDGADYYKVNGHADKASPQPDDTNTSSSAPKDHEAPKPDGDAIPADGWTGPITDEWTEHLVEVREGLDSARREGLTSKQLYTIDGAGEIWTEERDRLHDSIIEDLYEKTANVPCDFKAIIAGGLGGAGKTTVLTKYAGIDLSQYLMINPDDMKEEMARRGMIPEIEGLSPMEASELVHEESSYLASQLALRAQADGRNLIWDITMSSEESVAKRINELASAGYTRIDGLFVDISVETSLRRIESRHREGHAQYRAGDGLGGRYVPPEVIENQKDPEWGSKNMRTFDAIEHKFNDWSIYDNSVDGRRPVLVETSNKQQVNRSLREVKP